MMESEKQARSVMARVFNTEESEIPADASRENLAKWDSLMHMNFILSLEDEFGIEFTDKEIAGTTNLVELVQSIEVKRQ